MYNLSFSEQVRYFLLTLDTWEYVLFFATIIVIVLAIAYKLYYKQRLVKDENLQKNFAQEMLDLAQAQNRNFDIQLGHFDTRSNFSALLNSFDAYKLQFVVFKYVPHDWLHAQADVFFSVSQKHSQMFYKFRCKILEINNENNTAFVTVTAPADLDIGQKRSFFRMKPLPNTVKMLAVWVLNPNKPLPTTTSEVGAPLLSATFFEKDLETPQTISLADVSGSGLAFFVNFPDPSLEALLGKDSYLICLLVYNAQPGKEKEEGEEELVRFCCTGRVANIRKNKDKPPKLVVGIEFTNWAILESGNPAILWFPHTKATGVGPIMQWVTKMDIESRKESNPS